jgi:peptide/nickel transport system substrate-binding protein
MRAFSLPVLLALAAFRLAPLVAQGGTVVMAVGQEPSAPVPFIGAATTGNADAADQLFLRLTGLGSGARTTGDRAMTPELARDWRRVDSVTIEFTLDERARWHDGRPVTSRDVTFAWRLIQSPALGVTRAPFASIASVDAVDERRVRFRFTRPHAEQVYVAGFLVQPLPSHLLERIPAESLRASPFASEPVGNGPYRFARRVSGQLLELRAVPEHFRGRPGIDRVIFRFVPDPQARVNLLLAGETDLLGDTPASAAEALRARSELRAVTAPGNLILYLLFNSKAPGDAARAHPALADERVRQALALALDREVMARAAFGGAAQAPRAVRSQAWYWLGGEPRGGGHDPGRARRMLAEAGWRDTDSNGVLDREGVELSVGIIFPSTSAPRRGAAVQVEQMWRAIGVKATLEPLEGPVWLQRRDAGRFDVDIGAVNQDPSPSSLVQSWSCASASATPTSNVGRWCDAEFDRRLQAAGTARDPVAGFRDALARMAEWQPAVVIAAPANLVTVHRRYDNVIIRPSKAWTDLWRWRVRPGAELPRDRMP